MKKILLIILLLSTAVFAQTYDAEYYYGHRQNALSGSRDSDPIYLAFSELFGSTNMGTGDTYFVDPNVSYEGNGVSWLTAKDTLDEAINLCTSNNGDVIYIAQDATFTMGAAADEVDADIGGITIWGRGNGSTMPMFNYTGDVTGAFAIGADDITIINCRFRAAVAEANDAIEIEAGSTNLTLINCIFDTSTEGTHEFHECINQSGAVADRLRIINCRFDMAAGAARSAIAFRDADYALIDGCKFTGDYAVADINNATTASNFITISNCEKIMNGTIGGAAGLNTEPCIELLATTSGVITNCGLICNVATPDAAIVGLDMYLSPTNWYSETEAGVFSAPAWLTSDSSDNIIGFNDSSNSASTSSVTADKDGSIVERLEQLNVDANDIEEIADAILLDTIQLDVDVNDIEEYAVAAVADTNSIEYWREHTSSITVTGLTNGEDHLFDVDGGPILITSLVGIVTVAIDSNAATCGIEIDRDDGAADTEFTTLVNIEDDVVGTVYVFTDVAIPVLTPLVPGAVGSNTLMSPWFCPEGMIEQANSAANLTGTIIWYMTWKPLAAGVSVTSQ